jgi:hypothetical protein
VSSSGSLSSQLETQRSRGRTVYYKTAILGIAFEDHAISVTRRRQRDPTLQDIMPDPVGIPLERVAVPSAAGLEPPDVLTRLKLYEADWRQWLLATIAPDL